ncbi:NACHT domain-containing protein [Actinoplanes sp. NPDC049265]|uniref:NACHT domain-containing protein n=1 Tax=Actinoplanes sp. NPDC049265 TaxID=3363902 RepID=UPI00371AAAAF
MLFSLSGGIKPVSALSGTVARKIRSRVRKEHVRGTAAALSADRVAVSLIEDLTPGNGRDLLHYVSSPDFDQICFEYSLHRRLNRSATHGDTDEIRSSVRHQIVEGLRHFTGLDGYQRTATADLLLRDIVTAAEEVVPALRTLPDETEVAAAAQAVAVGVRNGKMLGEISSLGQVHEFSVRMRAQVRNVLNAMPLPHVRGARNVPYSDLWVAPECRELASAGQHPDEPSTARPFFDGRHVLLGAPGAGKSTMARKVAYDIARAEDEHSGLVPFLVVLRNFADKLTSVGNTIEDFIAMQCAEPYGLRPPDHAIRYLLQNGRAVVILDGLDELTRVTMRRRVAELIEGFAFNYPGASILVTSRKVGYEYAPLSTAMFSRWELSSFDDERVRTYAGKWFTLDASSGRSPEEGHSADRCAGFLRESEPIRDVRSNPLMLSLLCGLYVAEHFIPSNRADVYRRCAELMFAQWDTMREIVDHEQSVLAARTALQYAAWTIFRETTDGQIGRAALFAHLRRHFGERADEDIAYSKAEKFLEVCAGRSWVLAEVGSTTSEPIYAFVHRSFLEYFAAEYVSVRCPTVADLLGEIGDRIHSGEWPEVTHLAVQLHVLAKYGADDFARLLLRDDTPPAQRVNALTFVSRMLSYTGFQPALLRSVVRRATAMCLDSQEGPAHSTQALEAHPVRAILCESSPENLEMVRRALLEALEQEQKHRPSEVLIFAAELDVLTGESSRSRRFFWKRFADGVLAALPRFDVAAPDRSRRTLLTWQAQRDLGAVRELLESGGVEDLYSSIRLRAAAHPSPSVGLLGRDGWSPPEEPDAEAVADLLTGAPLPWLDLIPPASFARASSALVRDTPAPASPAELAVKTLLSLPYLEWVVISERRSVLRIETTASLLQHELVRARRHGLRRAAVLADLARRGGSDRFLAFLEEWLAGKISTVAAQPERHHR